MSTDAPQTPEGAAAAEIAPRKQLLARIKPAIPDWRPAAKRAAGAIAAVAAVGAVLGGLVGFWSTYKVVVGEWLAQKPAVVAQTKQEAIPAQFDPPRLSIALMPFDNLSGDASQDYFGDGVVENLATDLSTNIPNLLVIARGASLTYKGQKIDPKQVGRELNVRYLLQGSTLRADKNIRINARLVDSETGEQLWAERFDGDSSNILALQDQIAARISNSLKWTMASVGARQGQKRSNPDALDMLLRAVTSRGNELRRGINPAKETQELYRKALAIEPDNAEAQIGLALVLAEDLKNSRYVPRASRPTPEQVKATMVEVDQLLQKAIRTNAASSDAHAARAYMYGYEQKFDQATQELELARKINPNDINALLYLATCYDYLGSPDKALPIYDEIFARTTGKGPGNANILYFWGTSLLLSGRWQDAAAKYKQAQAQRFYPGVSGRLAVALLGAGNLDAANVQFEVWRDWWTAALGPPTIKSLKSVDANFSRVPAYMKLVDSTIIDGYRKLGVPEE